MAFETNPDQSAEAFYGCGFIDTDVDLTGKTALHCTFSHCTIRLDSFDKPIMGAVFNKCYLIGDGWKDFWEYQKSLPLI